MLMYKAKHSILETIYDISQLDEPVNLEIVDGILPNRKLQIIYYNLLWVVDSKVPKIDGIKSLLILLDYIYNKFDDKRKISPHLLARKNEIFYILIERIFNSDINKIDKKSFKKFGQYFYDNDFFTSFLIMLNKKDNSVFKEKFSFFSKVSIKPII